LPAFVHPGGGSYRKPDFAGIFGITSGLAVIGPELKKKLLELDEDSALNHHSSIHAYPILKVSTEPHESISGPA
jgi:hypothetical protein